jgi:hypothetical protein
MRVEGPKKIIKRTHNDKIEYIDRDLGGKNTNDSIFRKCTHLRKCMLQTRKGENMIHSLVGKQY